MLPSITAHELTSNDLEAIADAHMAAFPDSALAILGVEAVKRYYAWQFAGNHTLYALGATIDDQLVGFCFGGVFRGALSGFLRANRGFLVRRLFFRPWLLLNARVRDRFVFSLARTLSARLRRPHASKPVEFLPPQRFGILSIATHPAVQGRGVGRCLLEEMERIAKAEGYWIMSLTVHPSNAQAIGFYEHLGWTKITNTDGEWAGLMLKTLSQAPPSMEMTEP
jgi:ribosomal protein S18 acetylase RimI-like enzyme